ncbi:MAG: hypothetical protein KBB78_01820 [Candidatus Pacebacteria bacterium]|nr:hypothetical protein [Candidatus Paceibacterota bacterium]MBP6924283.1 hypothetical protein [Candidatus Paceibacterota bacterium]
MRTLLVGVLLTVSSLGTTATAQTERSFSLENNRKINFDVTVSTRARIQIDLISPIEDTDDRYRLPLQQHTYLYKDSCAIPREWVMVTLFQDCSHRSLKRARPMLKFIYAF